MRNSAKTGKDPQFIFQATAILLLSAVGRLFRLAQLPPGLSQDEVLNADIVENIRAGQHALFFREGFGHEPLYHYFAVPFQILLGDNLLSIRLPAVVVGMLLVAIIIRWARVRSGRQVALLTGILVAVSWWPIIFSRIGLRPIMLPLCLAAAVWAWETKRGWLAGALLGVSFYTYTAARVFLLLPLLLLLVDGLIRWRETGKLAPVTILNSTTGRMTFLSALLYLPLQITLWLDPTLQERVGQLSGPLDALRHGEWVPILESFSQTLGGFFIAGDPRWTYTVAGTPLFDWFTGLLLLWGIGLSIVGFTKSGRHRLTIFWLLLGLLPSALAPQAPSIIRLIGLLPLAFLLPVEGLADLIARIPGNQIDYFSPKRIWFGFAILLVVLNGGRAWQTGFVTWAKAPETADKYSSIWRQIALDMEENPPAAAVVVDSWVDPIDDDALRRNLGRDPLARWVQSGPGAAGALVFPAGLPSTLYVPEYVALDPQLLKAAQIEVPVRVVSGTPSFAVYQLPSNWRAENDRGDEVQFGEFLTLIDFQLLIEETGGEESSKSLALLSVWRIERSLPADLAFFTHLINEEGEIITQHDGLDGFAPSLKTGDILLQLHPLSLEDVNQQQPLQIRLGGYTRNSGDRLRRLDNDLDFFLINVSLFDDHLGNR